MEIWIGITDQLKTNHGEIIQTFISGQKYGARDRNTTRKHGRGDNSKGRIGKRVLATSLKNDEIDVAPEIMTTNRHFNRRNSDNGTDRYRS